MNETGRPMIKPGNRKAVIFGAFGQDGAYLAYHLIQKGYTVVGVGRPGKAPDTSRLKALLIDEVIQVEFLDLSDLAASVAFLTQIQPDEIYNLAANSSVAHSFVEPLHSVSADIDIASSLFEAVRSTNKEARIFQALSSEIFAESEIYPQTEQTLLKPGSPYGYGKACIKSILEMYRDLYGLYICGGILYNHESPMRSEHFVTRKIMKGLVQRCIGDGDVVKLGNLDAQRDWGFAGDYIIAMSSMLQCNKPENFIISTGVLHTVRELCSTTARCLDTEIEWDGFQLSERGICKKTGRVLIEVDQDFYRPLDPARLVGDNAFAQKALGWMPRVDFHKLIELCTCAEIKMNNGDALRLHDFLFEDR